MILIKLFIALLLLSTLLFAKALEPVTLQLLWKNQFQFAGFYVAKEQGFYEAAGLDVTIKENEPGLDVTNEVLQRHATFGIGRSSLILHKAHGDVPVILDAIFDHSPSILITTDPALTTPLALHGKRIMTTNDEISSATINAMLQSQGVTHDDVIKQPHSFNIDDLINKKTDAMVGYLSNEPFMLQERNISFSIINPKDFGYDFYGDLLFTSQQELDEHPKRVKAFVEASRRGWQEAFKHIDKTAKMIFERYNTQNKSLSNLIYEGMVLRGLCCDEKIGKPTLDFNRFAAISEFYRLGGLLKKPISLKEILDPLNFTRIPLRIGFLSKRGDAYTLKRWQPMVDYLNTHLSTYHFEAVPLDFEAILKAVKNQSIDFVLINTVQYVKLEHYYGISRIATLKNASIYGPLNHFGAVIITRSDNPDINTLQDIKNKRFGAVNPDSFGGWIMALKLLKETGIDPQDFKSLSYLQTHDNVVYALLDGRVDVATVRTDTLERMAREGAISLEQIKIINAMHYPNFPYLISTPLYPEWPLAKLPHTPPEVADALLGNLLKMVENPEVLMQSDIGGWGIPLNYKPIHDLLKSLQIDPYISTKVTLSEVFHSYANWIAIALGILLLILLFLFKISRLNRLLQKRNLMVERFNEELESQVLERTAALQKANEKLHELAEVDPLTGIANRRHFFNLAQRYFDIALRNNTDLIILSIDIDFFKKINDHYGHAVGDQMLQLVTKTISSHLRKTDLFGRIGGEEFIILLQSTSLKHAQLLCKKINVSVASAVLVLENKEPIHTTVSIGLASLNSSDATLEQIIKRSDQALYKAKEQGRNRIIEC